MKERILAASIILAMLIQTVGATVPGVPGITKNVLAQEVVNEEGIDEEVVGEDADTVNEAEELPDAIDVSLLTYTDVDENSVSITGYTGSGIDVVVLPDKIAEKTVTAIGASAFKGKTDITAVYIPNTVASIGNEAFKKCSKLAKVDLGSGVTEIGSYAFENSAITEVVLPEQLTTLKTNAFRDTESLSKVTILCNLTTIGDAPFSGALTLKEVVFGKNVTSIGKDLFRYTGLESITIPDTVTSIGESAFDTCTQLKKVDLGSGVTEIGAYAFDASGITEIVLPEQLTTLKTNAFRDTESLSKVTILGDITTVGTQPFTGANALKEVVFGENMTAIPAQMFYGTGIATITVPDTVISIGDEAFRHCESLKSVNLGSGVTTIGKRVFYQTGLETATLPVQLTSLGASVFGECTALEKVTLQGTLAKIGSDQFWHCENLANVIVGKDVESVPKEMFSQTSINSVMFLGDKLSIGSEAFGGCDKLKQVYFGGEFYDIHENAFFSTPNATFHTTLSSDALIAAIENGLGYDYADGEIVDHEEKILKANASAFYVSNVSKALGMTEVTTQYECKDNSSDMTQKQLRYYLPKVEVKSVTINEEPCNNYTYADSELMVPITSTKGTIVIQLSTMGLTQEQVVYARMCGDDMQHEETIGVMTLGNGLMLNVANVVSTDEVSFDGVAYKDATITVYVNDEVVLNLTANKLGYFEGLVKLNDVTKGKKYTLKVETVYDEETVSEKKTIVYDETQPELTGFDFYYSTIHYGDYRKIDLMTCAQNAMVYFAPAHGYQFKVTFNNRESLDEVYVVSRKNGDTKYMKAQWDVDMQCYYVNGYFDENNKNYVPGDLTVFYTTKHEKLDYTKEENLQTLLMDENELPSHLQNAEVEVVTNNEDEFEANITLENGKKVGVSYVVESTVQNTRSASDIAEKVELVLLLGDKLDEVYFYTEIEDNTMIEYQYSPIMNELITMTVDSCDAMWGTDYGTWKSLLLPDSPKEFITSSISIAYGINGDIVEIGMNSMIGIFSYMYAHKNIFYSNLSDEEKERQYAELHLLYSKYIASEVTNRVASLVQEAGIKVMASGNVAFGAVLICAAIAFVDYAEWYKENATGNLGIDLLTYVLERVITLKFLIDPSGYVYEGVTDNYLSGVTATIYYKMAEEEEPQIWNAEEYSQINPQVTDSSGYYAWDVPEALWRVKYEKDGYETVYSDWMEVPPIRTNVNVGLVSTSKPELQSVLVYKDRVKVAFSQYMYPETVKGITLTDANGNTLDYTLEYDQTRKNADEEVLATHFDLILQNSELTDGAKLAVSIPATVLNYAQNAVEAVSNVYSVQEEVGIETVETVNVAYADTISVPFRIAGFTGEEKIQIVSGVGCFIDATLKTIDESGCGYVDITGTMKGEVQLVLALENTDITTVINVCVVEESDSNIQLPENDSDDDNPSKDDEPKDDTVKDDTVKDDENQEDTSKDEDKKQEESKEEQQTPPHEHTIVVDAPVAATFDQDGSTEGSHCSTCGEVIVVSQVIPRIQSVTLNKLSYTYNGKKQTPKVTVKDSQGTRLVSNIDYVVAYAKGRKNVGVYSVTVTFKGKYAGVKEQTFTVLPKATSLTKITAKKKGFTAKWKKQSKQVTGYELQYSINKKFTKKTTKTVKIGKYKTITKTISKLNAKKKYYVRIRTYKTVKVKGKNTKLYSKWSKVKTVKTKK